MFGLDLLTVGTLAILASGPPACQAPAPTQINVIPKSHPLKYDYTRDLEGLQSQEVDTINPYDFGGRSYTQGFMEGLIRMVPKVKLGHSVNQKYRSVCLWYESIDIEISIDPTIVIAQEVYADECMRGAVLEHEHKHVTVDREIVNKYSALMGQKVYEALQTRGFTAGPIPGARAQATADRMQKTVMQIVEHEYRKMELERVERQRAVDSREEYDRVNGLCPKFRAAQRARRQLGR